MRKYYDILTSITFALLGRESDQKKCVYKEITRCFPPAACVLDTCIPCCVYIGHMSISIQDVDVCVWISGAQSSRGHKARTVSRDHVQTAFIIRSRRDIIIYRTNRVCYTMA